MPKQPISLRLDDDLLAAADALAAAMGTDRTELIARGLRRELLYEGGREFVYVLLDAAGEVRYVGRSRDPYKRLREHVAQARVGGSAKEAWLAQLLAAGASPRLAIIDDADAVGVVELESEWIEHFRKGGRLTNGVSAGVEPRTRTRVSGRKQFGMIDEELLSRVDAAAGRLGQTRRVFTERALEAALSEARGTPSSTLAGPVPVPSPEGVRPAASPRTSAPGTAAKGRQPTASHAKPATAPIAAPAVLPRPLCPSCEKFGPLRTRPCDECGHQRASAKAKR